MKNERVLRRFPLKPFSKAKEFFRKKYLEAYRRSVGCDYAVCLKKNDIPVGYVEGACNFGYGLKSEFRHKGIVFEAAQAVVFRLKADGAFFITATHDVNNPRNGRPRNIGRFRFIKNVSIFCCALCFDLR